jgi:hypothetical protein
MKSGAPPVLKRDDDVRACVSYGNEKRAVENSTSTEFRRAVAANLVCVAAVT